MANSIEEAKEILYREYKLDYIYEGFETKYFYEFVGHHSSKQKIYRVYKSTNNIFEYEMERYGDKK